MNNNTRKRNEQVAITVIRLLGVMGMTTLYFVMLLFTGCQEEKMEIIDPPVEEVIDTESPVTDLIRRVTLKDGSSDNVLDHSSCTQLKLPITVNINGKEVEVRNEEDLDLVEDLLGDDDLGIVFPVQVLLEDHTEITVHSESELEELIDDCENDDDDIECIDFQYPLSLSVYDTENQVTDVVEVKSDKALYTFLDELEAGELVSLQYPVILMTYDGSEIQVNDNNELKAGIEAAVNTCDDEDDIDDDDDEEDDEDDEEDDELQLSDLVAYLKDGVWGISRLYDVTDKTALVNDFDLTFNEDSTVIASNGILEVEGTWEGSENNSELYLKINFESDLISDALNKTWMVVKLESSRIELKNEDTDEKSELVIEK